MSELDMPVDTTLEEALGYLHGATFDMPGGAEAVKTVRAEIERLRKNNHRLGLLRVEAESNVDRLRQAFTPLCPCDLNPETTDGPQQECPIHGDGITFVEDVQRDRAVVVAARQWVGHMGTSRDVCTGVAANLIAAVDALDGES